MKDFTTYDWGEKRLPQDENGYLPVFETDENKYFVRANHITPRRWTFFELIAAEISAGRSVSELGGWVDAHRKLLNAYPRGKSEFNEIVLHLEELAEAMQSVSKHRFNRALYLCTLFCVTEGEDLTTWSEEIAEAKIDDWNKYGFSVFDFFRLAAIFTPQLSKELIDITTSILLDSQNVENSPSTEIGA